jgi:plasmid stabilization system protein ParE
VEVTFSTRALDDVVRADVWWRENRDAVELFGDEVAAALLLLEQVPRSGQRVTGRQWVSEVRRLVLRKSRFLLFYEVSAERVTVLRIWHPAQRPPAGP